MQTITLKNNQSFILRKLNTADFELLAGYLQQLSADTKKRFGPHPFDLDSIKLFYADKTNHGYIAFDIISKSIAAYAIIKHGWLFHDTDRLQSYGLLINNNTDCTFAPSVSDNLQGHGLGTNLYQFILQDIKEKGFKRIILWGGVQADNNNAVHYYKKHGFIPLGTFEYNGLNVDMVSILE